VVRCELKILIITLFFSFEEKETSLSSKPRFFGDSKKFSNSPFDQKAFRKLAKNFPSGSFLEFNFLQKFFFKWSFSNPL